MKTLNKCLIAASCSLALTGQLNAETFTSTAEISNAISLTETTPFSLGSLFLVKCDGTEGPIDTVATPSVDADDNAAVITLSATTGSITIGATGANEAANTCRAVSLGGEQRGVLSVSGGSAFTDVTITAVAPTATSNLVHSAGNPVTPRINILSLTALSDDGTLDTTLTLDGSGNGNIFVGGTFTPEDRVAATGNYIDGSYVGQYEVSVSY